MKISSRRSFHLLAISAVLGAALVAVPTGIDGGHIFGPGQAFAAGRPGSDGGGNAGGHTSGQDGGHDGNGCSRDCR
jgi:hypothetical protein